MAASTTHLLHHLIFKPSSPPSLLFIKPLCISTTSFHLQKPISTIIFNNKTSPSSHHHSSPPPPPPPLPHNLRFLVKFSATPTYSEVPSPNLTLEENPNSDFVSEDEFEAEEEDEFEEEVDEEEDEDEGEEEEDEGEEEEGLNEPGNEEQETQTAVKASSSNSSSKSAAKLPTLSVKERKELVSYAHSLGKKLKAQQVGKSGVTSSLASAFIDNLESNELLKIKVQNNCPEELPDVVKQLEEKTGSVAVNQIGRTVILYRPSLTKLKAGEKKKQVQRTGWKKPFTPKPTEEKKVQVMKISGRGRRGSSRNSS